MSKNCPKRAFENFAPPLGETTPLRRAITDAYRLAEPKAVAPLVEAARVSNEQRDAIATAAADLISRLRAKGQSGGVEGLVKE